MEQEDGVLTTVASACAQVVVLYVEQEESVRRQLTRAQLAAKHNTRVLDAGAGDLWELRPTDVDDAKCRRRYDVFKVGARAAAPGFLPGARRPEHCLLLLARGPKNSSCILTLWPSEMRAHAGHYPGATL